MTNWRSSKFFVSVLAILCASALAYMDKNVPELVMTAAIVGYHAANAYIKGRTADSG